MIQKCFPLKAVFCINTESYYICDITLLHLIWYHNNFCVWDVTYMQVDLQLSICLWDRDRFASPVAGSSLLSQSFIIVSSFIKFF